MEGRTLLTFVTFLIDPPNCNLKSILSCPQLLFTWLRRSTGSNVDLKDQYHVVHPGVRLETPEGLNFFTSNLQTPPFPSTSSTPSHVLSSLYGTRPTIRRRLLETNSWLVKYPCVFDGFSRGVFLIVLVGSFKCVRTLIRERYLTWHRRGFSVQLRYWGVVLTQPLFPEIPPLILIYSDLPISGLSYLDEGDLLLLLWGL